MSAISPAILIVDDSLTVRADLEEAFTEKEFQVTLCSNASQARAALARALPDLVILDVILPDGDGTDLLREIRATAAGAELPVLMLSTEAEVKDRIRGLALGANDYVGKPYDRDYLVARASELLGHGQLSASTQKTSVLIIDDSITFRERLAEELRGAGYEVTGVSTGEEGLRRAAANRPSVVITDGVLSGIDGPTVVRKLRLDAALRKIPCILLTGSDDRIAELHALDSGADAFVRKNEDFGMMLARVAAVLRGAAGASFEKQTESLLGAKKILAVDDSLTYLDELGSTLRGEGYDVILARSGEEALEMVAVQAIDCILLDRLMPGLGGTETCRRIKASAPLSDIPIIMLTATEDQDSMIEGLSSGADDYVLKSNEVEVLKARVRVQLRRKQSEDQNRRIRKELLSKELEAADARASKELADSRAELLAILEQKNNDLAKANGELVGHQRQIAEKNRQLELASHLKSEFLANMSHELRTPLNAIIGFSELLKDGLQGTLNEPQRASATEIYHGGTHLLSLINDVLDLSKVEAGQMTLDLESINIASMLQSSLSIVKEKAHHRSIQLKLSVAEEFTKEHAIQVFADIRKLKQIVYNLLSNAVKFTAERGHILIRARVVPLEQVSADFAAHLETAAEMQVRLLPLPENEYLDFLEISVTDNGKGIASEDLQELFQPFVQLESPLTKKHEGTGLGLALIKRLAELHGGTVAVASAVGRGSCFAVWLPLQMPAGRSG
ncbi:response regulator [Undibacterium sp.]|uniref:response regulator n=1 Tax=Undibacterium sp. TaxID=1914977 RepID=UPI002C5B3F54|nr:response regulator [Undibacterium sp.]HTD06109.1 response regulator [Undibacterium sp.]